MVSYQKDIFRWHCDNIYPFDKMMSKVELEYVHGCIDISRWEFLRFFLIFWDEMIPRLSFFCYSQRVDGDKVNKSRMAYGSLVRPKTVYEYAKPVLKERSIKLPFEPDNNFTFGGLGWDIDENHLKVYYRFNEFDKLSDKYKRLCEKCLDKDFSSQGILSWIYKGSDIVETKVYRYPKTERSACMFSKRRKDVQIDCRIDETFWDSINKTGQEIIGMYSDNNIYLDTITVKDKDHYTLYFPQAL